MALWSGIIDDQRATDWTGAGVVGGIPTVTTSCASLTTANTLAQINSAIASCSNGVVSLAAGTYTLAGPVNIYNSNVVLRGAGMSTILNITGTTGSQWITGGGSLVVASDYRFFFSDGVPPNESVPAGQSVAWSGTNGSVGTFTKGATVLNMGSTPTGLGVGDMLVLWQSDAADASLPSNGYFVSDKKDTVGANGISWAGDYRDHDGAQEQRSLVTAVSGTQVTIADPLVHPTGTWQTSLSPRAGWLTTAQTIRNVGIENLIVRSTNGPSPQGCVICIGFGYNVWLKGIGLQPKYTSALAGGAVDFGVDFVDSLHVEVRDSWIDTMRGGGVNTTTSYGVVTESTSFAKIENNIFYNGESPLVGENGMIGSVIAYNYDKYVGDDGQTGGIQVHSVGQEMNLVEGNSLRKVWMDSLHGTAHHFTYFRNLTFGGGFDIWSYSRWQNIIGNVINSATAYKSCATSGGTLYDRFSSVAFRLGYSNQNALSGATNDGSTPLSGIGVNSDSIVCTSVFLWGNYSVFGDSTHFDSADVPTAEPTFPNAIPASHTLPSSFIYSSKPSWFGSVAWPPIGSDVTGGNVTGYGGRANKIPAQVCYEATIGQNIANFNPTTCYAATTSPSISWTCFRL